jgi:hypothetical protein
LPRVARVKLDDKEVSVAVYPARCATGRCFVLAYMWDGAPRLLVVPAQPSPACVMPRLSREEARVVEEALLSAYRVALPYRLPACRVPRRLLRPSIWETLEALAAWGIVEEVETGEGPG